MHTHRVKELLELLSTTWQQQPELQLTEILAQLAKEAGHQASLESLSDDVLIYHLKMRQCEKEAMIPGLAKDQEDDFKTAILKARGIVPK